MTTEREEALELARAVKMLPCRVLDCDPPFTTFIVNERQLELFLILAKQRGAEEQKRKDVEICDAISGGGPDQEYSYLWTDSASACAKAIEKQP